MTNSRFVSSKWPKVGMGIKECLAVCRLRLQSGRHGLDVHRAAAAAAGIALEVGRELLELRQIEFRGADPDLAQVALVGGAEGHAFIGTRLHGKGPAPRADRSEEHTS